MSIRRGCDGADIDDAWSIRFPNFGHVEPGAMWRVVEANTLHDLAASRFAKDFNQNRITMGIEVVQNKLNALNVGIKYINQITYRVGKLLLLRRQVTNTGPLTSQWLNKQIARPTALILIILLAELTDIGGLLTHMSQQLVRCFIKANDRSLHL
ncbi:MAG: hypothetical protein M9930_21810 [Anaerolineae bacterium]|nr:hypothetical protein [Anaerolineae bacterium]